MVYWVFKCSCGRGFVSSERERAKDRFSDHAYEMNRRNRNGAS